MLRTRLASLAFAGGLFVLTGCSTTWDSLRPRNWFCTPGCPCEEVVCLPPSPCSSGLCPGGPLISNHPPTDGPVFPPSPTPLIFPGGTMPPAGPGLSPAPTKLPPVITIPNASPTPSPP